MSSTTIVFNADAAKFLSNLGAMKKSLLDNGDAVSRTKAKIVESLQQQTEAALKANKSQQELDRIQTKGAERLAQVTEQNAARTEAALDRMVTKQRAVAAEMERLGHLKVPDSAGHGFTDRMATSAVVRGFEGNGGIRSIENTLTMIPGFATAAQGLAPLIGMAGLTGLVVELGDKGVEAFRKLENAARESEGAFADLHNRNQVTIDDLEIVNQKLQDQIDKLSGHPNNGMATALLEARKRADELLVSLQADRKELEQLFKEHEVGFWQSLFTGQASTGAQSRNLSNDWLDMQKQLGAASTPQQRSSILSDRLNRNNVEIQRLQKEQSDHDELNRDLAESGNAISPLHNDEKIRQIQGDNDELQKLLKQNELQESIAQKQGQVGGLKQHKDGAELAQKAAEKQMKVIEQAAAELKAKYANDHDQLEGAEFSFWEAMAHAPEIMAANRTQVLDRFAAADQAYYRGLNEDLRKYNEEQKQLQKAQLDQWELMHVSWEGGAKRSAQDEADFWAIRTLEANQGSENYKHAWEEFLKWTAAAQKALDDAQRRADQLTLSGARNKSRIDDANLKLQERQGQISPHDAAMAQAGLNTSAYNDEKGALDKQLGDAQASGNPEAIARAQEAIQKASADRVIQIQEDAANIVGTTWQGALKNSLAVWVQDAQNTAQQVTQLAQQAISGLNENLVNGMFGDKTNWSGMFKGLGKTVATDGLKHIESAGLKAFGITAKADGSKENPYYVIQSGPLAGAPTGILSALYPKGAPKMPAVSLLGGDDDGNKKSSGFGGFLSKLFSKGKSSADDSDDDDDDDDGGGGFGGFFAHLFGGGKALGGDVQPGMAYDVGEMGRERFIPKVPGTIVPNHALNGGGVFYQVQVANGVTPEQMKMHVQEALRQYHPRAVAASVAAVHDAKRRVSAGRH